MVVRVAAACAAVAAIHDQPLPVEQGKGAPWGGGRQRGRVSGASMAAVATAQYGQRAGARKGTDAADNLGGSDAEATR